MCVCFVCGERDREKESDRQTDRQRALSGKNYNEAKECERKDGIKRNTTRQIGREHLFREHETK